MSDTNNNLTMNYPKYLYKYIGFDMFVNMIQRSSLTFSLFGTWDDLHEYDPVIYFINNSNNNKLINQATLCQMFKTYCQCWTELNESDAMWRIYSYGNKSIRIKAKTENLLKITDNLEIRKVIYSDSLYEQIDKSIKKNDPIQLYAIKRKAFSHEKEYRLIDLYRFGDKEDAKKHIIALNYYLTEFKDLDCKMDDIEKEIENNLKLINVGKYKINHKDIHVDSIENLIEGVMVNPFSPKWYIETVKKYCEINGIRFDGISQLYAK